MNQVKNIFGFVALTVFLVSSIAQARGYIGGLGGYTINDKSTTDGEIAYGGNIGIFAGKKGTVGFGAHFLTAKPNSPSPTKVRHSVYAGDLMFRFGKMVLGARVGVMYIGSGLAASNPELVIGGKLGFDIPLGKVVSFGMEGAYNYVNASTSFATIDFLGSLKFWF